MKTLRVRTTLAVGALAASIFSSHADAAVLDVVGSTLVYEDTGTTNNDVRITEVGGSYQLTDPPSLVLSFAPGAISAGCYTVVTSVLCPAAAITAVEVDTGPGADTIDLSGLPIPATMWGGPGNDAVGGGTVDDTFVWQPGDGTDVASGNGGSDWLYVGGSNDPEAFTIRREEPGFVITHNVHQGGVEAYVEQLSVQGFGGQDVIDTVFLTGTQQSLDGGVHADQDLFLLNAEGKCPWLENGVWTLQGYPSIDIGDFFSIKTSNRICGAFIDYNAGVLRYTGGDGANHLVVTRDDAAGLYTFTDTGDPAVTPTPRARDVGCANVAQNAVTCLVSEIASFDIFANGGDDTVSMAGAIVPALIDGASGSDTLVGGESDDTFLWESGRQDGDDTFDGGPGSDTLRVRGANYQEVFTVTPVASDGFSLHYNVEDKTLTSHGLERLDLDTKNGLDIVATTSLRTTGQRIVAGEDPPVATLIVDADQRCLLDEGGRITTPGRPDIEYAGIDDLQLLNAVCLANPCKDEPPTMGCTVNGVPNQLCVGTLGDDRIVGTPGPDVISGDDGRDRLYGGGGDDVLCGRGGDDRLMGGDGHDIVMGGSGNDRLNGNAGDDVLLGGDDADQLNGSSGLDALDGGAGSDRLKGGADADTLDGGPDPDLIDGGSANDTCRDPEQVGPFLRCEL